MKLSLIPRLLIFFYGYVFISTELLSLFRILSREYVLPIDIAFLVILFLLHKKEILSLLLSIKLRSAFILALIFLFLLSFIQGLFSAPSTTDSMVYHIPRIMYWIQDKTLIQNVIRGSHDFMAPFGEYITLHLYFVTNSDRLLFFSQWLAYVGSVILCVCIAKKLLSGKVNTHHIGMLAATLPIAVLQSSSTQTDLVTAVMVLLSSYYALSFKEFPNFKNALALGLSVGLGILTKATFIIYLVIPLGIVLLALVEKRRSLLKVIIPLLLSGFLIVVLQLRFLSQNLSLFGSLSGQPILEKGSGYTNEYISPSVLISNITRNSFTNLPVPVFNRQLGELINSLHYLIGLNINDPATTYTNTYFEVKPVIYPQEDIVSSPIHFLLIIIAIFFVLLNRNKIRDSKLLYYFFGLSILSFVIFCLILKWQPFHTRLLIPFLLLGSVCSVIFLEKVKGFRLLTRSLLILSIGLAFILVIFNVSRPYISYNFFYKYIRNFSIPNASIPESFLIKPRDQQYFNSRYYWYAPYNKIAYLIEPSDKNVTFKLMDGFEYPLWLFLKRKNPYIHVVSSSEATSGDLIITTAEKMVNMPGFDTNCIKTEINYGYVCLSRMQKL